MLLIVFPLLHFPISLLFFQSFPSSSIQHSIVFMASSHNKCPSSSIQSITVYNNYCPDSNQWLPTIISMNSWILLQRKKRKVTNYNDYLHSFKGRVRGFKVSNSNVQEVRIQHAYMHSELRFESWPDRLPRHRPNCKNVFALSFVWEWTFFLHFLSN